jgi:hypothetical protein
MTDTLSIEPAAPRQHAARAPDERPWFLAQLLGRDDEAVLAEANVETFRPSVLRYVRLRRRELSLAQRKAARDIVRARPFPLLGRSFVFARGISWQTAAGLKGGLVTAGDDYTPVAIPTAIIDRLRGFAGNAGAIAANMKLGDLLGIPTRDDLGGTLQAVLSAKAADVETLTIVKILLAQARAAES